MKTIKDLKSLTLSVALGLAIGAGILSVQAWTEPQLDAPQGNLGAPLNTSTVIQTKTGGLNMSTSSGNVGVGTSAPLYKLDVSGTGTGTLRTAGGALLNSGNAAVGLIVDNGSVRFDSLAGCNATTGKLVTDASGTLICGTDATGSGGIAGSGTLNYVPKWTPNGSTLGDSIIFAGSTNVGIGTNSPVAKLQVDGSSILLNGGTGSLTSYRLEGTDGSGVKRMWALYQMNDYSGLTNFSIYEYSDGNGDGAYCGGDGGACNNRFTIQAGGNVGIGVTSPERTLDVNGNMKVRGGYIFSNVGEMLRSNDTWLRLNQDSSHSSGTFTPGLFRADGGVQVDGRWAISADNGLHRAQSANNERYGYYEVRRLDGLRGAYFGSSPLNDSSITYIGLDAATRLQIAGGTNKIFDVEMTAEANAFVYQSDERLKKDIKPLENSSNILNINPSRFVWKKDGKSDIGVIAQEVEKHFPEFVITDENGYKSVDYPKLVVPLLGTVNDQQGTIEDQQGQIDELRRRLENLENR